jgi:hypothetical protein
MKYQLGDYIRIGKTMFTYYKVVKASEQLYKIQRCGRKEKALKVSVALLDRLTTVHKVNEVEVLLYAK